MTRMILLSLAAVAMLGAACERHPVSELEEEHGHTGAASHATEADPHHAPPEPSALVSATPAPLEKTAPAATPLPGRFFPSNQ